MENFGLSWVPFWHGLQHSFEFMGRSCGLYEPFPSAQKLLQARPNCLCDLAL